MCFQHVHKNLQGLLSLVMSGENNGKMIANLQSPVLLVEPLLGYELSQYEVCTVGPYLEFLLQLGQLL